MIRSTFSVLSLVACIAQADPAAAREPVRVSVSGTVDFNGIPFAPLSGATPGAPMEVTFLIDSAVFVDSSTFPTRGYPIDESSFELTIDGIHIGLQDPFPGTPYFVLRNDDPAVDGFFIASSVDFPTGVATDEPANLAPTFVHNFSVTYVGSTLSSLDVLGALGTYDFTGLTVFGWTMDDGPFQPLGGLFGTLTIETLAAVPGLSPGGVVLLSLLVAGAGVLVMRRCQ